MRLRKPDNILALPFRMHIESTEISVSAKISIYQGAGAANLPQLQASRGDHKCDITPKQSCRIWILRMMPGGCSASALEDRK